MYFTVSENMMDVESLYDFGEEEQDFYEEAPGARKGYPIDHRFIKVSLHQYIDFRLKNRKARKSRQPKHLNNMTNGARQSTKSREENLVRR